MITVKEFDEIVESLTEKMQYISDGLESLWQHVFQLEKSAESSETRIMLQELSSRIESLQFNGYTNPSQFANKMRFQDLYDIVAANEKAKDLDKLEKLEDFYESIKSSVEHFKI